jgi:hypothetical protein
MRGRQQFLFLTMQVLPVQELATHSAVAYMQRSLYGSFIKYISSVEHQPMKDTGTDHWSRLVNYPNPLVVISKKASV